MTPTGPERDAQKQAAAEHAATFVESGMTVGLGTGSTAVFAVRKLGAMLADETLHDIRGIPTSSSTAALASEVGIPLTTLDEHSVIDLTIDGADEVDPALNLIKGAGGALLHEKVVAQASLREVIAVDASKPTACLGTSYPLPVEVVQFGWQPEAEYLEDLGAEVVVRQGIDGRPFVTDEGNWILDAAFGPINDLERLNAQLSRRAGVVEHGLFIGLTTELVIGGPEGVEHRT